MAYRCSVPRLRFRADILLQGPKLEQTSRLTTFSKELLQDFR